MIRLIKSDKSYIRSLLWCSGIPDRLSENFQRGYTYKFYISDIQEYPKHGNSLGYFSIFGQIFENIRFHDRISKFIRWFDLIRNLFFGLFFEKSTFFSYHIFNRFDPVRLSGFFGLNSGLIVSYSECSNRIRLSKMNSPNK